MAKRQQALASYPEFRFIGEQVLEHFGPRKDGLPKENHSLYASIAKALVHETGDVNWTPKYVQVCLLVHMNPTSFGLRNQRARKNGVPLTYVRLEGLLAALDSGWLSEDELTQNREFLTYPARRGRPSKGSEAQHVLL